MRVSCRPISPRFLQCLPVLKSPSLSCPLVSFCVLLVPRVRDTHVTRRAAAGLVQEAFIRARWAGPERFLACMQVPPDEDQAANNVRATQNVTGRAPALPEQAIPDRLFRTGPETDPFSRYR